MNRRSIVTAVPLVLVNAVAFSGQLAFLRDHLGWPFAGDIIFAAALESVAIFLAYMAHAALLNDDSSFRLRVSSYLFGLTIGAMNASHYMHDGRLTFAAIALGLMSSSSPFLWSVYSRRQSRDQLKAQGLIEGHAVRLGITRWMLHPGKAFRVFSMATWTGEPNAADAIAEYELRDNAAHEQEAERVIPDAPLPRDTATPRSKADAVAAALVTLGVTASASDVAMWLQERGISVTASYVRQVRSRTMKRDIESRRDSMRAISNAPSNG